MEENIWELVTEFDHVTQFDNKDEFVVINNSNTNPPIFPPNNHQDLPLTTPEAEESDEIQEVPRGGADKMRWTECFKMINYSGIIRVACKVRFYAVCVAKFWPVAIAAAAGLVVIVLYRKVKPWRRPENNKDQWMVLISEKDQKINHLLLQIAKMNDILSASQRVPVHRVGCERQ